MGEIDNVNICETYYIALKEWTRNVFSSLDNELIDLASTIVIIQTLIRFSHFLQ